MKILPLEQCFKKNNFDFFPLKSTTSTMDVAKLKINSNMKNCIVLANEQTKGRGRLGSKWTSPQGNIYCSFAFFLDLKPNELYKLIIITSVAIKHSLNFIGINNISFKWPNDIFCNNKKISGVIQESYTNNLNEQFLIIGIGINYLSSPNNKLYQTTHITEHNTDISKEEYFEVLVNYFLEYHKNLFYYNYNDLYIEYSQSQMFLNSNIKIKINDNKIITGQFIGINYDGSLILKKDDKELLVYSGQIQI